MDGMPLLEPVRLFLTWWHDELLTFVPRQFRTMSSGRKSQLVIALDEGRAALYDIRGGQTTAFGEIPLNDSGSASASLSASKILANWRRENRDVTVTLPRDWILTRVIRLPTIAEKSLLHSISYQLERCTPFRSDEVYYGAKAESRDRDAKEIEVTLQFVAKSMVDDALIILARLGLRPTRMCASPAGGDEFLDINLLPNSNGERSHRNWKIAMVALALLATMLAATAIWLPLEQKRQEATRLAERIAVLRSEIESASQMATEIDRLMQRIRFLPEQRHAHPPAVQVLSDLTDLLPDDTWLYQLQYRSPQLEILGYSSSASKIIELLEDSPKFLNPAFSSRVSRDSKIDGERFHIRFETVAVQSK